MADTKKSIVTAQGWDVVTALGIAALIVLMFVMVMHHPVASHDEAGGFMASIAKQASTNRWTHGTLAVAMTVMSTFMLGFACRLGLRRPHVLLGAVATGLALVLICLSVLLDGFVASALAERCVAVGGACTSEAQPLLRFGGLQIEFMTRAGLLALASATALWAIDLAFRRDRVLPASMMGLASAAVQFGILLFNGERLNPQNLALIVAAQAIWYVAVGFVIYLQQGPYQHVATERPAEALSLR